MLPQRLAQRVTQRAAQTTRLQVIRQPIRIQKRSASDLPKFEGAEDNAFNRERAAVKAHAKETTGKSIASPKDPLRSVKHHSR